MQFTEQDALALALLNARLMQSVAALEARVRELEAAARKAAEAPE
jgi:BMFP domain-containing protein YqiC